MMLAKIALLAALAASLDGCGDTPQAKAAEAKSVSAQRIRQFRQREAQADANPDKNLPIAEWIMPYTLREISGLALTTRGTVLTHDDNVGRVSEIDPRTGILLAQLRADDSIGPLVRRVSLEPDLPIADPSR